MGTLTHAELREEVHAALGRRFDGTEEPGLSRITVALNLAQTRIARKRTFQEMRVSDSIVITNTGVIANDLGYEESSVLIKETYSLNILASGSAETCKLIKVPQRDWDLLVGAYRTQRGLPTHYSEWRNSSGVRTFEWYRIPDESYTVYRKFARWPVAFVVGNDSQLSILDAKDDVLIEFAAEHLFRSLGELELAAQRFTVGNDRFADAVKLDADEPDMDYVPRGTTAGNIQRVDYASDPFQKRMP